MPSWVAGAAGTFAISAVSAYLFLRLRCRGIGYPLGPRARWWAITIVAITAIVSTGLGAAAVAVSEHIRAAYVGVVVPSGLWLGQLSSQRRRHRSGLLPGRLIACLTFPIRRLDDRMGDDMQDWCDVRSAAASENPQLTPDAANHYCLQVVNQIKDGKVRDDLRRRRESINHKVRIVQLIDRANTPARLRAELQRHPGTRDTRKYNADDPALLSDRLTSEAETELHLLLAHLYQLGYRKLVIYLGFKLPAQGWRRSPTPQTLVPSSSDPDPLPDPHARRTSSPSP